MQRPMRIDMRLLRNSITICSLFFLSSCSNFPKIVNCILSPQSSKAICGQVGSDKTWEEPIENLENWIAISPESYDELSEYAKNNCKGKQ